LFDETIKFCDSLVELAFFHELAPVKVAFVCDLCRPFPHCAAQFNVFVLAKIGRIRIGVIVEQVFIPAQSALLVTIAQSDLGQVLAGVVSEAAGGIILDESAKDVFGFIDFAGPEGGNTRIHDFLFFRGHIRSPC
jgi:hypothetical protein